MNKVMRRIILLGFIIFISGCTNYSSHIKDKGRVEFSCQAIYVDTSDYDITILFKINVLNHSRKNFYFFSNPSILHRDSVKSNFYLQDSVHNKKYQLLSGPGLALYKLYSGKIYNIPLLMIQEITWNNLKNIFYKGNVHVNLSDSSLVIELLKGSNLFYISSQKDFESHHINLKYWLKDTIPITFSDSTSVYFTIPDVKGFLSDSSFKRKHYTNTFLIR